MNTVDERKKNTELAELARRIRKARKSAHLSQAALAKSIGVSDKSVSAYEKGRSTPPFSKLKKIAEFTNHPMQYFTEEQMSDTTITKKIQQIEKELAIIRRLLEKNHPPANGQNNS